MKGRLFLLLAFNPYGADASGTKRRGVEDRRVD
jgi:hypothetical protein